MPDLLQLSEPGKSPEATWYAERAGGALGRRERDAAHKAAVHAGTPTVACFDSLGRPFLTLAHNRFLRDGAVVEERLATRVVTDVEGNQREVVDAKQRSVMRYGYDLLGHRIQQASQEAGERRMLQDVTGKPIYLWDSRGHTIRTTYDALRRTADVFLRDGDGPETMIGSTVYGESLPDAEAANLRGKVHQIFDTAGVATSERYDFKGNAVDTRRQLAEDYQQTPDWSASPALEAETFVGRTVHDALNRPIQIVAPHALKAAGAEDGYSAVLQPTYNEAGLLETLDVWPRFKGEPAELLDAAGADLHAITNLDYNASGQRTRIAYGNGARTDSEYDPKTFRLLRLRTRRGEHALQDLSYTFDPVGNITDLRDDAQQTIFFRNRAVEPSAGYTYDALYRLIEATGREHLGQGRGPEPTSPTDAPRVGLLQPGDGDAMGRYLERYVYDAVGNFLQTIHQGDPRGGWTRTYRYAEPSQLERDQVSNRLTSTATGNHAAETYAYDAHGNMTAMPHLSVMQWDFKDELQAVARQVTGDGVTPQTTYYVYDGAGQRVRKVTERSQTQARLKERLYLGGFEVYREYAGDGCTVSLERETLHVMDGQQRVALVETRTKGSDPAPAQLVRYQMSNHLGSATLELDEQAQIISYEEYYPYGSTSYQAVRSRTESPKRYRYTGKERDEESGFSYHSHRYYAPWIARWISCDPTGLGDGVNIYSYARNRPTLLSDPGGTDSSSLGVSVCYSREAMARKAAKDSVSAAFIGGLKIREFDLNPQPSISEYVGDGKLHVSVYQEFQEKMAAIEASGVNLPFAVALEIMDRDSTEFLKQTAPVSELANAVGAPYLDVAERAESIAKTPRLGHRQVLESEEDSARSASQKLADGKPTVMTHELFRTKTIGPKHGSISRSVNRRRKDNQLLLERALRWWGGPGPVPDKRELDLGHAGIPYSRLRPGETTTIKAQRGSDNRSIGAGVEKADKKVFIQKSRQLGLDPHSLANPFYVRPRVKR